MDEVTWAALTLTLTALGGIYTWFAFRRRGVVAGLRGAGFTLIPLALYLTDTLRLVTRIADAVGDWAVHLVLSPTVWLGMIVAAVAFVLIVVSGFLRKRGVGASGERRRGAAAEPPGALPAGRGARNEPVVDSTIDDELAEIEALLRKRGIT